MDRTHVWPVFREEDVLFEDDDLLAVHKRDGVPSQAAEPERPDDLVTRIKMARKGIYLGVHQRLDRDTSGILLFTKRTDANPSIAKQFEGRLVEKRYLAAVTGRVRDGVLADHLLDGRVVPASTRGAQRSVTRVKVRETNGDRALCELSLETGRMHQARVQLAHAGAPIAGDPLYGGAAAARLMLHAASLGIEHPRTKKRMTIADDRSKALSDWVKRGDLGDRMYDDASAIDAALALAIEKRWGLAQREDAFRLVNEEGDAMPSLAVDVYGSHLVAQLHLGETWDDLARRERVLDRLHALGFDGVYLKLRPRQANALVETRRDDVAPKEAVRGTSAPAEIEIEEEGVKYRVRLGDGLSTGIFLDQRANRRLVKETSRGLRVLNLFSYTCAFSIAAAAGGAKSTTSVDASLAALERGRNGFADPKAHVFAAEDAFSWLVRAAKKEERFDLVILDPPSYSSTKKRRFVAESDYDELVELAARVMNPGGRVVASCNHRGLSRSKLRKMVGQGIRAAGIDAQQIKDLPNGSDFPPPLGREPHMKAVLATLISAQKRPVR